MKKVANLKNVYRASYKYYKLMKDVWLLGAMIRRSCVTVRRR